MPNLMAAVVLVPVALILIAALGGVAIGLIFNVNQTGWDVATVTIWNLIPVIAIVVIFLSLLALAGLKITGTI
ncbi:unnamed protein product [marine sediment metagenome]|uniref:Uncharacterized protein n=1 Tax=marine sediment metagenome TaxID=412755 RepID=X1JQ20_9ZZZZ